MCTEKEFELCATKNIFDKFQFVVIGLYRLQSSNVKSFCNKLDTSLKITCSKFKNVILAHININELVDNHDHKLLLDTINWLGLVDFPTIIIEKSCSAIDTIMINLNKNYRYSHTTIIWS